MRGRLTQSLCDTVLTFCRNVSGKTTRRRRRSVWSTSIPEALEGRRMPATLIGTTRSCIRILTVRCHRHAQQTHSDCRELQLNFYV